MNYDAALLSVESAARDSYSQLLSFLAARSGGDVAGAEDALSEAFLAAMKQWPLEGVPEKPEAWLLTTARRRLIDGQRRERTRTDSIDVLSRAMEAAGMFAEAEHDFPDERLKLLFVCAHPAIDPAARTPLMLQTVLGHDAETIAGAFLTSPSAMSQRLVRAKGKIRDAAIPFSLPGRDEWPERIGFVNDAIYAAFTTGLTNEALWLARVLAHLLPDEPETLGLLALLLHSLSRRQAGVSAGKYVPLPEQDTAFWDHKLREEAEALLHRATRQGMPGRFQLEAAIHSVHAARAVTGATNWTAIVTLYDALITHTSAIGARIGRAIAVSKVRGPEAGLELLDSLPADTLVSHQPYWAARGYLLMELSRESEAREAFTRAIGLCTEPAMVDYLVERVKILDKYRA